MNRVQTLRSSVTGNVPAPATRAAGELWANFADKQLGVIDASRTAQKLLAVRFFATTAAYVAGDVVVQAGELYVAKASVPAGAFNSTQWNQIAWISDILAPYVLPTASTTTLGGVKIDGSTININGAGVISSAGLVTVAASAPSPVQNGALWFDLVGGQLYVWANDGTSSQWVVAVNQTLSGVYLPTTGGTLTGPLTLAGPPVQPLDAVTKQYVDASMASGDNRIINGDMRIDQRNNGNAGTAGAYMVDRWQYNGTVGSKIQWQRGGSIIPAFQYSMSFTSTSAYTPLAADYFIAQQLIEADMIGDFAWGAAGAQPVTLSFWARSTIAGTFSGSVYSATASRSYPFAFSLAANVATQVIVNIPGDTTGAWVLNGNAASVIVLFSFGVGSNSTAPAGAWVAGNKFAANGSTNLVAVNGATFWITGVKLETGSVATPFNRQSLAKSMADCQRYYSITAGHLLASTTITSQFLCTTAKLAVSMRAVPTLAMFAFPGIADTNINAPTIDGATVDSFRFYSNAPGAGTAQGSRSITASAEL